ncbi:hypothetical protein EV361DRAFT_778577, partial [Lentinula raphanica]
TILYDSGLPFFLWAYASAYIVYTDNLIPAARVQFKIPAEIWHKRRMDVAHLRPFGAMGWGTITNKSPGKLDLRAFKGRLIGYGMGRGTYLLYTSSGRVV